MKNITAQIEAIKRSIATVRPRSRRRVELELQLRDLMTKRLRYENRKDRRAA
jgi:hypothetical protein